MRPWQKYNRNGRNQTRAPGAHADRTSLRQTYALRVVNENQAVR